MKGLFTLHKALKELAKKKNYGIGSKSKRSILDKLSKTKMDTKGKIPMDAKTKREMNRNLNEVYGTNRKLIK